MLIVAALDSRRAVHFQICLVHNIYAVLVAKQIKFGAVRVVRGAYSVYVQLLHKKKIALHFGKRDACGGVGRKLVSVYTPKLDMLSVYLKDLSVYSYVAKADALKYPFSAGGESESVERGSFGAPRTDAIYLCFLRLARGNNKGEPFKFTAYINVAFI